MTDQMNIYSSQQKELSCVSNILQMMHAFGDCAKPLVESAMLIEKIVYRELKNIIFQVIKIADLRDSLIIDEQDFIFLLKRNKVKLNRLMKYLELKELKSTIRSINCDNTMTNIPEKESKKKSSFQKFLSVIDITESMSNKQNSIDYVKNNRNSRAEYMTRNMSVQNYLDFSKARVASFNNGFIEKFVTKLISENSNIQISKRSYSILGYLAHETVAQIVDFIFLLRNDNNTRLTNVNNSIYKPYIYNKNTAVEPITPMEIHEAVRRYSSLQLDSFGPFQRSSVYKKRYNPISI